MTRVTWRRAGVFVLLVGVVAAATFWAAGNLRRGEPLEVADGGAKGKAARGRDVEERWVTIGGVKRRASDVERPASRRVDEKTREESRRRVDYGTLPPTPVQANRQVKSVADALTQHNHPERYSSLARPASFDAAAYEKDPAAYLNVVEPTRVFQSAQPGDGVRRLRQVSSARPRIVQGKSTALRVATTPRSPVTFTSFDAGAFQNRLTSITVQADDGGLAEAKFTATPGTISDVHILAASPTASGQARFVVNITMPQGVPKVAQK